MKTTPACEHNDMYWSNRMKQEGGQRFTADELDCCTIRPKGAVGSKALVPRIVLAMLGAEGGAR